MPLNESNNLYAKSYLVTVLVTAKSGLPTSLTNKASPVKTACYILSTTIAILIDSKV